MNSKIESVYFQIDKKEQGLLRTCLRDNLNISIEPDEFEEFEDITISILSHPDFLDYQTNVDKMLFSPGLVRRINFLSAKIKTDLEMQLGRAISKNDFTIADLYHRRSKLIFGTE